MTKQNKIDYINKVNDRFINSRNHGNNGGNWWYPTQNTIAYNVKMYNSGVDNDKVYALMTDRQKEFNKDSTFIEDAYTFQVEIASQSLVDDIESLAGVKDSGFAGRSGGWFEVNYINSIDSDIDINSDIEDIESNYKTAKALEELESQAEKLVKERKASLEKYLSSEEFIKDIVSDLYSDEDIAEIYKGQAQSIINKLK